MFILSYKFPFKDVDSKIELLQFNDIFDVFYESPLEITTDDFGYGYIEDDTKEVLLKVAFNEDSSLLDNFKEKVTKILEGEPTNIEEINYEYEEFKLPPVELLNNFVLCHPEDSINYPNSNIINFISQGAFGTGLHETTHDILNYILSTDFTNLDVLDIGTGSGILSIATAIKGANEIIALDIRDVTEEIELNSSLNNLSNIKVKIGDALSEDLISKDKKFDFIYINIGGEETAMFMDFIVKHLKPNGRILVSGLVTWSYDMVKSNILSYGFETLKEFKTNEWCTSIFKK